MEWKTVRLKRQDEATYISIDNGEWILCAYSFRIDEPCIVTEISGGVITLIPHKN